MTSIKPIPGFETTHSIDSNGIVYRNLSTGLKPLDGSISYHGYRKAHLRSGVIGKVVMVHRLVAELFIGECRDKDFVVHINDDKLDNRVENLKYVTRKASNKSVLRRGEKNPRAKLTNEGVKSIRSSSKAGRHTQREIAIAHGISERTVQSIIAGKTWAHLR